MTADNDPGPTEYAVPAESPVAERSGLAYVVGQVQQLPADVVSAAVGYGFAKVMDKISDHKPPDQDSGHGGGTSDQAGKSE
jgi:hypothetical protein